MVIALLLFTLTLTADADDLFIRSGFASGRGGGLFDVNPSKEYGKTMEIGYVHIPFAQAQNVLSNLFIEAAIGHQYGYDYNNRIGSMMEFGGGARLESGPVRVQLSQTLARFSNKSEQPGTQLGLHFGVSFMDSKTGLSLGVRRAHYSNLHEAEASNNYYTGLNYTGLVLMVPL